jgi:phosphoglycolate phosphatase
MFTFLFDIDGTLLDTRGAGRAAFEAVLAAEFGVRRMAVGVPFAGRTDRAIVADLFHRHGIDDTPAAWDRFVAAYLRRLRETLPRHQGCVLPGVTRLVDHLRRRDNVLLGLLTGNLRSGARMKLAHYGLADFFSFGGFGDDHTDRDDVARAAREAADGQGGGSVDGSQVVVVGDTPHDVRCGRAIGAEVIAVATGTTTLAALAETSPDLLLEDLSDITAVVDWIDRHDGAQRLGTAQE